MTEHFINPAWRPEARPVLDPALCGRAYNEIRACPGYQKTPLQSLDLVASQLSINSLLYKDEGPRFGLGSFKALGAPYALSKTLCRVLGKNRHRLPPHELFGRPFPQITKLLTATCATDGNHGRALAWACSKFGCGCRVYVPSFVSSFRRKEIEKYGAHVTGVEGTYDDAAAIAERDAAKNNWLLISDMGASVDSIAAVVMRGYAAVAYEVLESASLPVTHCFVQAGGGGFAATMADVLCSARHDEHIKMIVVEPKTAAGLFISATHSRLTPARGSLRTIAGGLACGAPSRLAWRILRRKAFAFITVTDEQIVAALRQLAKIGITAGETGAVGFAGVVAATTDRTVRSELKLNAGANVLVIGTEGATDPGLYEALISSSDR